eukprot:GEMP01081739.1.p1 GENE.GEMP01081739.1~~GEMP01081739.1.p1  ORF type:complete len:143 (+),score=23.14 GEMP01081739.1:236-664(+)
MDDSGSEAPRPTSGRQGRPTSSSTTAYSERPTSSNTQYCEPNYQRGLMPSSADVRRTPRTGRERWTSQSSTACATPLSMGEAQLHFDYLKGTPTMIMPQRVDQPLPDLSGRKGWTGGRQTTTPGSVTTGPVRNRFPEMDGIT